MAKKYHMIKDDLPFVTPEQFGAYGNGSTDDSLAIQKVVDYSITNKAEIEWGSKTYLVTSNIVNFHAAIHKNRGIIKRDTDTFYVTPRESETSILYVGYGANDANDGLTKDKPMHITKAVEILKALGDKAANGQWRLQFTEGVYTGEGVKLYDMPFFAKSLQIFGVHNGATHLATWDGLSSNSVYAFRGDGGSASLNIDFKDIKFTNWNKHPTNAGAIVIWEGVNVNTFNVRIDSCTIGIWCRGGYSTHYADEVSGCVWGYGFQYHHTAAMGSSIYNRNKITGCQKGIFIGRNSVVHADYTDFLTNTVDLQLHQKSRVACVDSTFMSWTQNSIWLQGDSIFEDDGSTWDANSITDLTPIYRLDNGSSVPATHTGSLPYRVAHYVPTSGYTLTGTTTDTLISGQIGFGSPLRIPKQHLYNKGTVEIVVRVRVDVGGANGAKYIKLCGDSLSNVIATVTIQPGGGGGLGEAIFRIQLRENGTGMCRASYESSNTQLNTLSYSSISTTVLNAVRDKTKDLTMWRLYGKTDNVNDSMSFFAITTDLLG